MIDVVIVNWNAGALLESCVSSVIAHASGLVREIVIVDNGSTDGSPELVEPLPLVKVIRTERNLGFASACNIGAAEGAAPYVLFLNPDAEVHEGTFQGALVFMEARENAGVGICGVQLFDSSGRVARSCARFPSMSRLASQSVGIDRIAPGWGCSMEEWDHMQTRVVDQVIGAFFFMRRAVFADLKGFDERFFVYMEEVDLAFRAKQAGWISVYLAQVSASHVGGGTTAKVKSLRLFFSLRSRVLFAFKHFARVQATIVLMVTLLVEPITRCGAAIINCSWSGLRETLNAYRLLWRWLPRWLLTGATR